MTPAYALFRLPGKSQYAEVRQHDGGAAILDSYGSLSDRKGFVIAPFAIGEGCPLLIIRPDIYMMHDVPAAGAARCCSGEFSRDRDAYDRDFAVFHGALADGTFQKIVLSRCSVSPRCGCRDDRDIFFTACRLYPDMFVTLFSAPECGTWLAATPEILIEGCGGMWHTMALAGTMRNEGRIEWSSKNMREQKYVEDYIGSRLARFSDDVAVSGPCTSHAGSLVHLRSDFHFTLRDEHSLGSVIESLHPTPAVCGLPKEEAMRFIIGSEHSPRRYYSGFSGMMDACGETHLFVSLRCMNISDDAFTLYAGGGLLDASTAESEWMETEAKMETIRKCII